MAEADARAPGGSGTWAGTKEAVGSGGHELAFVHAIRNETDVVFEGGDQSR